MKKNGILLGYPAGRRLFQRCGRSRWPAGGWCLCGLGMAVSVRWMPGTRAARAGSAASSFPTAGSGVKLNLPSLFWQCYYFFKKKALGSKLCSCFCMFLVAESSRRLLSSPLLRACCDAREGVGGPFGVVFIRVPKAVRDL